MVEMNAKIEKWMADHPYSQSNQETIKVPVTFHIIFEEEGATNEVVGREQEQFDVMNQYFAPDFEFYLDHTYYYVNATWWTGDHSISNFRQESRVGGMNMMNVWWNLARGYLGYATYPFSGSRRSDGIVNNHGSVLGGSINGYNQGKTWLHEAGHWLGLYHSKWLDTSSHHTMNFLLVFSSYYAHPNIRIFYYCVILKNP